MDDFQSKYGPWALVTGANAGIGRAIAEELAARRLNIVAVARREPQLETLQAELQRNHGVQVLVLPIDLTAPDAVERIEQATRELEIGLVVPAAGAADAIEFAAAPRDRLTAHTHLNVIAPMQLVHLFVGKMKPRKRGGVLFISSLFAYQGIPYVANYAATKAYILLLGEALHFELKRYGIDVSVLSPGLTRTDMPARMPLNFSRLPMFYQSPEQVAKVGIKALGRKATVVPGFSNKFYAWQNRLMPRAAPIALFGFLIRRAFKPQAALEGRRLRDSVGRL